MKAFFRFLLLGLVLVLVALGSALTAMRFAIHGSEVAVPDLVGKAPAEAKRIAEGGGLEVSVERQYYSPVIAEGKIVSQSPPAGTHVRRGWQIRVAASLGPQRTEIPDVMGESERAAEINVRRRGLDLSEVAQIAIPGISVLVPDRVLAQNPPPKAGNVSAPKINLLVSAASQPPAFVMPSFVGQQLGGVTLALQNAGMHLASVSLLPPTPAVAGAQPAAPPPAIASPATASPVAPSPVAPSPAQSPSSVIVSQTPAAGDKIIAGEAINLVVR
jgi:beta-lactam-binding protein with PASTA domain